MECLADTFPNTDQGIILLKEIQNSDGGSAIHIETCSTPRPSVITEDLSYTRALAPIIVHPPQCSFIVSQADVCGTLASYPCSSEGFFSPITGCGCVEAPYYVPPTTSGSHCLDLLMPMQPVGYTPRGSQFPCPSATCSTITPQSYSFTASNPYADRMLRSSVPRLQAPIVSQSYRGQSLAPTVSSVASDGYDSNRGSSPPNLFSKSGFPIRSKPMSAAPTLPPPPLDTNDPVQKLKDAIRKLREINAKLDAEKRVAEEELSRAEADKLLASSAIERWDEECKRLEEELDSERTTHRLQLTILQNQLRDLEDRLNDVDSTSPTTKTQFRDLEDQLQSAQSAGSLSKVSPPRKKHAQHSELDEEDAQDIAWSAEHQESLDKSTQKVESVPNSLSDLEMLVPPAAPLPKLPQKLPRPPSRQPSGIMDFEMPLPFGSASDLDTLQDQSLTLRSGSPVASDSLEVHSKTSPRKLPQKSARVPSRQPSDLVEGQTYEVPMPFNSNAEMDYSMLRNDTSPPQSDLEQSTTEPGSAEVSTNPLGIFGAYQQELKAMETKALEWQSAYEKLLAERDEEAQMVHQLQEAHQADQALIQQLQSKIEEDQKLLAEMQSQLEKDQEEADQLQAQQTEAQQKVEELLHECDENQEVVQKLEAEREEDQQLLQEMQGNLESMQSQLAEMQGVEDTVAEQEAVIAQLQRHVDQWRDSHAQLLEHFEVLKAQNKALSQQHTPRQHSTGVDPPPLEWQKADRNASSSSSLSSLRRHDSKQGPLKEIVFGILGIGVTDGLFYGTNYQYRLDYGEARVVDSWAPAADCGVVVGDVITAVNGFPVNNLNDLRLCLLFKPVELTVRRGTNSFPITIRPEAAGPEHQPGTRYRRTVQPSSPGKSRAIEGRPRPSPRTP